MTIQLVRLFRCKICNTKVFERDTRGHLRRHGVLANGESLQYFTRCRKKDTPESPGYHHRQIYQSQSQRRKRAQA